MLETASVHTREPSPAARERAGRAKQTLLGIANPKPPGNLIFSEWECEQHQYRLRILRWLTVLSACETGLVDFREIADEHYGLPLGFLFAGAPTVWGTLWTVNDQSTALLMRAAYQNLTGESAIKPAALRDAQRWLRDAKAEELVALVSSKQAALGYDRMAWADLSPFRRGIQHGFDPQACPFSHPYYCAGMQCVGM